MKTVTIQIGNSDNKLTQKEWSDFVGIVHGYIADVHGMQVHFFGCSSGEKPWQNAAWVIEGKQEDLDSLKECLVLIRGNFQQDSIAWTEGATLLV